MRFVQSLLIVIIAAAAAACEPGSGDQGPAPITKDEARDRAKADDGFDWCEYMEWYGDGICDDFCPSPDPDCNGSCGVEPAAARLLVAIEGGGAVLVDPATGETKASFATGSNAFGALLTPDGRRGFVTDKDAGTLAEIDPASGEVRSTVQVGTTPQQPALAGDRLYIPLSGAAAIAVVDISGSSPVVLRTLPTGEGTKPHIVAVSPDGKTLWATIQGRDPKIVSFTLGATGEGPMRETRYDLVPRVIAASNEGAWFTAHHSTGLHRANLADGAATTPYMDVFGDASEARKQIEGVDVTADGSLVALTHEGRKALVALTRRGDGSTETLADVSPLSASPYWVTIDPGEEVLYVSIPASGDVEAYTVGGCKLWTAHVGGKPKRMSAAEVR